jgi:hypothetical protein
VLQFDSDKGSTAQRVPKAGRVVRFLVQENEETKVPVDFIEVDTDARQEPSGKSAGQTLQEG